MHNDQVVILPIINSDDRFTGRKPFVFIKLTKDDVCNLLGYSRDTLDRRIKKLNINTKKMKSVDILKILLDDKK